MSTNYEKAAGSCADGPKHLGGFNPALRQLFSKENVRVYLPQFGDWINASGGELRRDMSRPSSAVA